MLEYKHVPKEVLYQLYIEENKTLSDVAEELNLSIATVQKKLVKYNIPICEFYNTGRYIMRNAMKIGLVLAALAAAGVYSVSAEDVSQQAVLNGTVVSVIEAGTPVKEGDVLVSVDSLVGGVPAARADRDGVVKEVRVSE